VFWSTLPDVGQTTERSDNRSTPVERMGSVPQDVEPPGSSFRVSTFFRDVGEVEGTLS